MGMWPTPEVVAVAELVVEGQQYQKILQIGHQPLIIK